MSSSPTRFFLAIMLALLGTSAAFGASSVAVKDGNIVVVQDGRQRQLTKSGKDAAPALSPDGKWVAFTRVGNPASTGSQGDCKSGPAAGLCDR